MRINNTNKPTREEIDRVIDFLIKSGEAVKKQKPDNSNIFNSDDEPIIPEGYNWTIKKHKKNGEVNLSKIVLYLDIEQKNGYVKGNKLIIKLKGKKVLNANVLDYLLAHPELIPKKWKGKYIFFWGTIYRGSGDNLYVRCLGWDGSGWGWNDGWLGGDFGSDGPAALAS
jgi:hypothetical protein